MPSVDAVVAGDVDRPLLGYEGHSSSAAQKSGTLPTKAVPLTFSGYTCCKIGHVTSPADYLTLTFDGGRFASHRMPVEVLAELRTVQQLITRLARHLFFAKHVSRTRISPGFPEAAQLYLSASEPNCFTAHLERPHPWANAIEDVELFDNARDLGMRALVAAQAGEQLPLGLPEDVVDSLAALGRRLNQDESLFFMPTGCATAARVDHRSRQNLARVTRRDLEVDGVVEGEVETVHDTAKKFTLRSSQGDLFEVPFEIEHRDRVLEACKQRPLARVRAQGILLYGSKARMKSVEELEFVDDERGPEILKLWTRIDSFATIADGWLDGEGVAPTVRCRLVARTALARLLIDGRELAKPAVFPTPYGGVQAEWILGRWAADVAFFPDDETIIAEAVHADSGEEREAKFSANELSQASASSLASWLAGLTSES